VVNGKTFEGGAGDIFVIKAGEIHSFKAVGDSPLIQVDVHLRPHFIQENLWAISQMENRCCSANRVYRSSATLPSPSFSFVVGKLRTRQHAGYGET
jgi:AraC-like ligand binding domain